MTKIFSGSQNLFHGNQKMNKQTNFAKSWFFLKALFWKRRMQLYQPCHWTSIKFSKFFFKLRKQYLKHEIIEKLFWSKTFHSTRNFQSWKLCQLFDGKFGINFFSTSKSYKISNVSRKKRILTCLTLKTFLWTRRVRFLEFLLKWLQKLNSIKFSFFFLIFGNSIYKNIVLRKKKLSTITLQSTRTVQCWQFSVFS